MNDCYHFIGVGGIGMSGLARILLQKSIRVSGSDIASNSIIDSLIKEGLEYYQGHSPNNIPNNAIVVYTSGVKSDNIELQAAVQKQLPILHRSELLARLSEPYQTLAVAGTHGKTTTSSILAFVLSVANLNPSFVIGGVLPTYATNAHFGGGNYFVIEADESDGSFLQYNSFGAIITNIDNDHLDYYQTFDRLIDNFKIFISQIKMPNYFFWCRDDAFLSKICTNGISYGFHPQSDWRIISFRQEGFKMFFSLENNGKIYEEIELNLIGEHNIINAAGVFGLASHLGISEESIRLALRTFGGVLRRCEVKGSHNGILFIDDYAHHPTEIQTTLAGIKKAIGSKRLIAIHQPHRYTRTLTCFQNYTNVFDVVDELFLTDIYGAGETPIPDVNSDLILNVVKKNSDVRCRCLSRSFMNEFLSKFLQPNDVVVTLGAGDITRLSKEVLALLQNESAS